MTHVWGPDRLRGAGALQRLCASWLQLLADCVADAPLSTHWITATAVVTATPQASASEVERPPRGWTLSYDAPHARLYARSGGGERAACHQATRTAPRRLECATRNLSSLIGQNVLVIRFNFRWELYFLISLTHVLQWIYFIFITTSTY